MLVVLGPVSVEVMLPLMFVYCPATFPNTLTEIVQLAFAESVAPLKLIMEVLAVAVVVPPVRVPTVQEVANPFGLATNNPVGRVSEKPTPVNAVVVLGLVRVNRSVLVLPCGMGEVRKLFESVGSTGRGQPLILMLSIYNTPLDGVVFAPAALMRKEVVLVPVVVALYPPKATNELPLVAELPVPALYAPESALE